MHTENLLVGLFGVPGAPAVALLAEYGVDRASVIAAVERLRQAGGPASDAEALATLGIDLDEVRRQAEEAFGPGALDRTRAARRRGRLRGGHIPFHRDTEKALELALREAVRLKHRHIGTEHLLLGLLHAETGAARHILAAHGVTLDGMRAAVAGLGRGAASG
ncbi:Clp protease [Pseudonocardia sp. K10HN5]|uniref:Clp protease n=1 Tax=Pseudonocardia acidicola TaxID=2724939 RepID=A0ABX1SDM5_9PSEU|nr:Clp protease [Pseudonocardia acidicola]